MKKTLFLWLFLMMLAPVTAQQQRGKGHPDFKEKFQRLTEKKWDFIQKRLALTPQEAEALHPVMVEYDKQRFNLIRKRREILRVIKGENHPAISDKEALQKTEELIAIDKELYRIKMAYYDKIRKILPPRKAFELIGLESAWRQRLMHRNGKKHRKPRHPNDRPHILNNRR